MKIVRCELRPSSGFSMPWHAHPYYEFHYIVSGSASFATCDRTLKVNAGDLFCSFPDERHRIFHEAHGELVGQYIVCVRFSEKDSELERRVRRQFAAARLHSIRAGQDLAFAKLAELAAVPGYEHQQAAAHGFISLVWETLASAEGKVASEGASSPPVHKAVARTIALLNTHVNRRVTLDEIAATVELEKSYLNRLFRRQVGLSPIQYAMQLRVKEAAKLLRSTSMTTRAVANELGFADEYHLSKVFKTWTGLSPSRYRNRPQPPDIALPRLHHMGPRITQS